MKQRLVLIHETLGPVWTCAWCAAGLTNGVITHREDCRWIAEVRSTDTATIPDRR